MSKKMMEHLEDMLGKELVEELPVISGHAKQVDSNGAGASPRMLKAEGQGDFPDGIHILAVDVTTVPGKDTMIGNVWIMPGPKIEYLIVQVEMLQNGICIGKNTYADLKRDTMELHVKGALSGPLSEGKLQMRVTISAKSHLRAMAVQEQIYPVEYLLGTDTSVDHIKVNDPTNIRTPVGTTIHVSFDRRAQLENMIDYDYTDYRSGSNMQPVYLDMNGKIFLKSGYEYIEGSYKTEKIFLTRQNRYYEYQGPQAVVAYNKQENSIEYHYDNHWNTSFNKTVEGACALVDYRLLVSFRYKDPSKKETSGLAIVSSKEYNPAMMTDGWQPSNYMKIPNVLFYWGCMEENTEITMADGTKRKIKDIRIGDKVMDKDGRGCTVENIFKGAEEMLLLIRTMSGKQILVTKDHPFWTRNGEKAAIDLVYEDELLMEDGSYERIEGAGPIEKYFIVYSLVLQPSGFIWGNGFAVGDWENQGKSGNAGNKETAPEIVEEINRINSKLYQD